MSVQNEEDAGLDLDFDSPASWDSELARIQGQAAGLPEPEPQEIVVAPDKIATSARTVEFMGQRFRIAARVGLMPLLKFSAYSNMSTADPGALSAMYAMLRDCIERGTPACGKCPECRAGREFACADYDPGDWDRFERHAIDTKAEADDLLDVISSAMELISGRPTGQPSPSSAGRRGIPGGSTARSSARGRRASRR